MANQMIALQARAPQSAGLGSAIQQNAQMINMLTQQRAAERQAAQAQQKMDLEAQMAGPQLREAEFRARSAEQKAVMDFMALSYEGIKQARSSQDVVTIANGMKQIFDQPIFHQLIDQTVASLPQDEAQFSAWQQDAAFRTLTQAQQLERDYLRQTTGREERVISMPKYGVGEAVEVPGSRIEAAEGIQYVRDANGAIIPMPKTTGGDMGGGLVTGERGGSAATALQTNPGAIKDGAFARSQPGYTGASGGFATFKTPEAGVAAQEKLLRSAYVGKGVNTIDKIVNKYAPQGPENSPASVANYKKYISQRTGIDIGAPISAAQVPAVAAAMREFETGNRPGGVQFGRPIAGTGGKAKPSTEAERRFGTVAKNMASSLDNLTQIIKTDPNAIKPGLGEYAASQVPFYGEELQKWAQSEGRQQFEANILAVLDNITYVNTGAGTTVNQEKSYRTSYVPTAQDTPASANAKLKRLGVFIANLKDAAGVMWTPEFNAKVTQLQRTIDDVTKPKAKPKTKTPVQKPTKSLIPDDIAKQYGL